MISCFRERARFSSPNDSPSSTSAISYVLKLKGSNTNTHVINRSVRDTDSAAYDGRSTTTITAIEIGV